MVVDIPYWLCGVNFKIEARHRSVAAELYHTDSVESTSKSPAGAAGPCRSYTILTLWSQLQNCTTRWSLPAAIIPYWLCGVNFKMRAGTFRGRASIYHTDSVESTSKCEEARRVGHLDYTILTLWSQLQNSMRSPHTLRLCIPYWLCGVNFKMERAITAGTRLLYHTDSVESTSKS